jgi:hypothetical protein
MNDSYVTAHELKAKRDKKAIPHLEQYAPLWIVDEKLFLEEDAVQFNVLFNHPTHGWVSRRYRYDGFNNTLYHKGQNVVDEDDALEISLREPYISATVADIPNSYGG